MDRDNLYKAHILEAIEKIEEFTAGMTYERFLESRLIQDAVFKNLEVIGEAANRLSKEFQERFPTIPWRQIVDMRNWLVHDYFKIKSDKIWNTIQTDLPKLKSALNQ